MELSQLMLMKFISPISFTDSVSDIIRLNEKVKFLMKCMEIGEITFSPFPTLGALIGLLSLQNVLFQMGY